MVTWCQQSNGNQAQLLQVLCKHRRFRTAAARWNPCSCVAAPETQRSRASIPPGASRVLGCALDICAQPGPSEAAPGLITATTRVVPPPVALPPGGMQRCDPALSLAPPTGAAAAGEPLRKSGALFIERTVFLQSFEQ